MAWRVGSRVVVLTAVLVIAGGVLFTVTLLQEVVTTPSAAGHHDFLAFQAAAQLIVHGNPGHLYDAATISALERGVIPTPVGAAGYMPYLTPPLGAVIQAPLGAISEPAARFVWLALSVPLAAACCGLATAGLAGRARVVAALCLLSTFPFFQALVEGQWSPVMLAGCLLALAAARGGRPGWAGAGLAVLALKPPLLVPVIVVLLLTRGWRTLLTLAVVLVGVVVVTMPFTGVGADLDYAGFLVGVVGSHVNGAGAAGASVWQGAVALTEGFNGLVTSYVGQQNVVAVDTATAVLVLAVVSLWGRTALRAGVGLSTREGHWVLVAAVAAALLTDLHLYPQDCMLLLVALPALTALVPLERRLHVVVAAAVLLDSVWLDQLAVTTHVFTWLLALGFVLACGRAVRRFPARPNVKDGGPSAHRRWKERMGWTELDREGAAARS